MNQQVRAIVTQEDEEKEKDVPGEEELIELETNPRVEEEQEEEEGPFQLLVHGVYGTSSGNQAFTLTLQLGKVKGTSLVEGKVKGTTLVDSGSSATFIDTNTTLKAKCKIQNNSVVRL